MKWRDVMQKLWRLCKDFGGDFTIGGLLPREIYITIDSGIPERKD